MYCVFSKFLLRRYAEMHNMEPTIEDYANIKPSKLLRSDFDVVFYAFAYSPVHTKEDIDGLMGFMTNFPHITKWVRENILNNIKDMSSETLGVKLRIVTSMLLKAVNNLPTQYVWTKSPIDIYKDVQHHIIFNLKDLHYDISTEDLPF